MVGKSIYAQFLKDVFPGKFINLSFGQFVRDLQNELKDNQKDFLAKWGPEITQELKAATVKKLLPLETTRRLFNILTSNLPEGKSVLFDGIPRDTSQYPMVMSKMKELSSRDYKVIIVQLDLADQILDARIESRRICPQCNFTDSILTPVINSVEYNPGDGCFYLVCPKCHQPLVRKKGDKLTPAITKRRTETERVMKRLKKEVPESQLIYLRMDVLTEKFEGDRKDLNLTASYSLNSQGEVVTEREPLVANWQGKEVYSLSPRAAVVKIIEALVKKI